MSNTRSLDRHHLRAAAVSLVAVATLLTGCSKSVGSAKTKTGDSAASSGTRSSDTSSSGTSTSTSTSTGSNSSSKFCKKVKEIDSDPRASDSSNLSRAESAKFIKGAFDDLVATAPKEIKDDVVKLRKALIAIADVDTSDTAAYDSVMSATSSQDLQAASDHFDKFVKDECGIDLNSGSSTDSSFSDVGSAITGS